MPSTMSVKHRKTGEVRDVFPVDAQSYNPEDWEILGRTPDVASPKPITTTMGKPIVPDEPAPDDESKVMTAGRARRK